MSHGHTNKEKNYVRGKKMRTENLFLEYAREKDWYNFGLLLDRTAKEELSRSMNGKSDLALKDMNLIDMLRDPDENCNFIMWCIVKDVPDEVIVKISNKDKNLFVWKSAKNTTYIHMVAYRSSLSMFNSILNLSPMHSDTLESNKYDPLYYLERNHLISYDLMDGVLMKRPQLMRRSNVYCKKYALKEFYNFFHLCFFYKFRNPNLNHFKYVDYLKKSLNHYIMLFRKENFEEEEKHLRFLVHRAFECRRTLHTVGVPDKFLWFLILFTKRAEMCNHDSNNNFPLHSYCKFN